MNIKLRTWLASPMNENQMTLGRNYESENVIGWFASEKLDGCRAYWDGSEFWTRGGNVIDAPDWFKEGLPCVPLDGEIWCGRGQFKIARTAVQWGDFSSLCQFMVFDAPGATGTWGHRMEFAANAIEKSHAVTVRFWRAMSLSELAKDLANILRNGGEGIMLRNPATLIYERGRTSNLLKVKASAQLQQSLRARDTP